jgi:nanoRNase/pAp phosphatase (c-di-AMP/oligoRNAs hydrolase)
LAPEWEHIDVLPDLKGFSAVALVDTQPGAGNNSLPPDHLPQIVIDHHHPLRDGLDQVPFFDVRPEVGATASMVYEYLDAAGVKPDSTLATALFYGVQTDTRGLARGGSITDEYVYLNLLSHLDRLTLIRVEQAGLSRDYYRAFCNGLEAARVYEHSIIASLGDLQRPDLTAEMADILIRMEGIRAVLCLGIYQETLFFSLRTESLGQDAGLLVQRIIVSLGKAGGHGTMAGGQVSLAGRDPGKIALRIERRFLKVMNERGEGETLLVD